uniref:Uncharacterized protein n=1 Tax=Anguilla anguilla TaxID=7936 RepID=A0A0E9VWV4_ANGAN
MTQQNNLVPLASVYYGVYRLLFSRKSETLPCHVHTNVSFSHTKA